MADRWMWSFEADKKWLIVHGTPGAGLVPFRLDRGPAATLTEVLFIADCVAFDHDTPTVVQPSATTPYAALAPVTPVLFEPGPDAGLGYFHSLHDAFLMLTEMRIGGAVGLRYCDDRPGLTEFESRFSNRTEPLALYAMATRQVDTLSEYLCLYRVLEWAQKDNAKLWIENHLALIASYDFGELEAWRPFSDSPVDAFAVYRNRAITQLEALHREGLSDRQIAAHLYDSRNALAHGKSSVRVNDFDAQVVTIAADLPIVKLLARMVVEGV